MQPEGAVEVQAVDGVPVADVGRLAGAVALLTDDGGAAPVLLRRVHLLEVALEVDAELAGIRQTGQDVVLQREVGVDVEGLLRILVLLALGNAVEELVVLEHGVAVGIDAADHAVVEAQRAVRVVRREDGEVLIDVATHVKQVVDVVRGGEDGGELHLLVQLEVEVGAHGEALLLVALDGRLVLVVGAGEVVLRLVGTAVHADIALECRAGVVVDVKPIGVGGRKLVQRIVLIGEGTGVETGIGIRLACQFHKLLGIEHLGSGGAVDVGNTVFYVDTDAGLTLTAFLRGDEHNAIAAVGTVDGRGGSIFQYGDALNIVGIEKRQRTDGVVLTRHLVGGAAGEHRHAVDNPQRLAAGRQ